MTSRSERNKGVNFAPLKAKCSKQLCVMATFLPQEVGTLDIVDAPSFKALHSSLGKLGDKPLELTFEVFVPESKRKLLSSLEGGHGFPAGVGPLRTRVKFCVSALKQLSRFGEHVRVQGSMCHESISDSRLIRSYTEAFEADFRTDLSHGKRGTLRMSMYLGRG